MKGSQTVEMVGGSKEFASFVKGCCREGGLSLRRPKSIQEALAESGAGCAAYLFLPEYEKGERMIPEMDFESMERLAGLKVKGQRLFIENYSGGDYNSGWTIGHIAEGDERGFHSEYLVADGAWKDRLPGGRIMQARTSFYLPGRKVCGLGESLLLASDCIGVNSVFKEGTYSFPVLVKTENYYSSAMTMTDFKRFGMLPHARWKALFALLFSDLFGIDAERVMELFDRTWPAMRLAGGSPAKNPQSHLAEAVRKAVSWHERSGLLLAGDGGKGMFELIRSRDLKVRRNIRTDATLLTGLLFVKAGKHFGNTDWQGIGNRLVDHLLNKGIQVEDGPYRGFFKWYLDLGLKPEVWSSDTSRDGLAIINMYKLTGEPRFLERAVRLGDAMLRWFGDEELICGFFPLDGTALEAIGKDRLTDNSVYYGEMTSFLLQLYKHTGDGRYKEIVLRFFTRISSVFPHTMPFGFSDNFTFSRYLMMLAAVQEILGQDLADRVNPILEFFKNLQDASGGIRETPIRQLDHTEAGVGIGDGSDNIADLLYCNNFVFGALSVIRRFSDPGKVDMALVDNLYSGLREFLLSVQINDEEKAVDGGWMRAFDMSGGEYYGLNKDKDWGAYCIMAGWITGVIPLTMLGELGEASIFV